MKFIDKLVSLASDLRPPASRLDQIVDLLAVVKQKQTVVEPFLADEINFRIQNGERLYREALQENDRGMQEPMSRAIYEVWVHLQIAELEMRFAVSASGRRHPATPAAIDIENLAESLLSLKSAIETNALTLPVTVEDPLKKASRFFSQALEDFEKGEPTRSRARARAGILMLLRASLILDDVYPSSKLIELLHSAMDSKLKQLIDFAQQLSAQGNNSFAFGADSDFHQHYRNAERHFSDAVQAYSYELSDPAGDLISTGLAELRLAAKLVGASAVSADDRSADSESEVVEPADAMRLIEPQLRKIRMLLRNLHNFNSSTYSQDRQSLLSADLEKIQAQVDLGKFQHAEKAIERMVARVQSDMV